MKPIVYIGLFLSILLSGCTKKWLVGDITYSGHVFDPCTGKPQAHAYILFYVVGNTSHRGNARNQYIGDTITDQNGNFSYKGHYDLTEMNNSYGVYSIKDFYMDIYTDSTKSNLLTEFTTISTHLSGLEINAYTINNYILLFKNTSNIINPDSTIKPCIYISTGNFPDSDFMTYPYAFGLPTKPYTVGSRVFSNDTCLSNYTLGVGKYYFLYYRKTGNVVSRCRDSFNLTCSPVVTLH